MRRLRADVSHRMRPGSPSIFTARWFRILLGGGLAAVLGLLVGPSVAGWLATDLPRTVWLLSPWSGAGRGRAPASDVRRMDASPASTTTGTFESSPPGTAAKTPAKTPEDSEETTGAADAVSAPGGAPKEASPAGTVVTSEGVVAARPALGAKPGESALTTPAPLYRIQVGAFLEHQNADRLIERLRTEGLSPATSVFEQSRVLYRIVVVSPAGGGQAVPDGMLEHLKSLGFTVESTEVGPTLEGTFPLGAAVDLSHRLRGVGVPVTLRQEVGSATYRVVRVGSYGTSKEAEEALARLSGHGFEGFVVRER